MFQCKTSFIFGCILVMGTLVFGTVSISFPKQSIQWRTPMGEVYSPYERKGYYHKAMVDIGVPIELRGDYYIGIQLNSQNNRQLTHTMGTDTLDYFVSRQVNSNEYILDFPLISTPKNTIELSFTGNNLPVQQIPLFIWIDPGQSVVPGTYKDHLILNVYEGPFSIEKQALQVASGTVEFSVDVSDRIEVALGNEQFESLTDLQVIFDEVISGATQYYDVFVQSSQPYQLWIQSQNKGVLRHEIASIKTSIAFDIYLDQQPIQLDENGQYEIKMNPTNGSQNTRHKIKLILKDTTRAFKGQYSDIISIYATPN